MRHFQKIVTPCLLALAFILAAPAQAQNPRIDLELSPTGAMPEFSGTVAIYTSRTGVETFAIRVNNGLFKDGVSLRVTVVHLGGEELDVALMPVELGSAYFRCNALDENCVVFPTAKIAAFFVYFKDTRVLETKFPS